MGTAHKIPDQKVILNGLTLYCIADDISQLGESHADLETILVVEGNRLKISRENSKYMAFQWDDEGQAVEVLFLSQPGI